LAVAADGLPWVNTPDGGVSTLTNGQTWEPVKNLPQVHSIAVGGPSSDVWVLAGRKIDGEYKIWKMDKNLNLSKAPGKTLAIKIAVDHKGNPWIVNIYREIWKLVNGKWMRVKGRASDIAIMPNGRVFILTRKQRG